MSDYLPDLWTGPERWPAPPVRVIEEIVYVEEASREEAPSQPPQPTKKKGWLPYFISAAALLGIAQETHVIDVGEWLHPRDPKVEEAQVLPALPVTTAAAKPAAAQPPAPTTTAVPAFNAEADCPKLPPADSLEKLSSTACTWYLQHQLNVIGKVVRPDTLPIAEDGEGGPETAKLLLVAQWSCLPQDQAAGADTSMNATKWNQVRVWAASAAACRPPAPISEIPLTKLAYTTAEALQTALRDSYNLNLQACLPGWRLDFADNTGGIFHDDFIYANWKANDSGGTIYVNPQAATNAPLMVANAARVIGYAGFNTKILPSNDPNIHRILDDYKKSRGLKGDISINGARMTGTDFTLADMFSTDFGRLVAPGEAQILPDFNWALPNPTSEALMRQLKQFICGS